jgi:hypothetical protein
VARQTQGEPLTFGTLLSSIGHIRDDDGPKYLSYEIRHDMTGDLNFWDSAAHIWLRANRFQLQKQNDGRLTIEGSGVLQNGTSVTFSILAPNHGDDPSDVSITLGNGYFVAGSFRPTQPSECKVHKVLEGGRITEN